MSKELPYFKFEPGKWLNGNIQLCSDAAQSLFINICATYWDRLGDLSDRYVIQKLCKSNAKALEELIEEGMVINNNGNLSIGFLDEQLSDFQSISNKRSKAATKRWGNAKAMQLHSKSNAIKEKRREEKSKEQKILSAFQNNCLEVKEKLKINDSVYKEFMDHWTGIDADTGMFMWQSTQNGFNIESRLKNWSKNSVENDYSNFR